MNDASLKAKINNIAKSKNISPQAVLQNYLMNRFLYRLSLTEYKERFVIKGGMLISSIIGIDHRSTMDIDATLRNISLSEQIVVTAMETICGVESDDGIEFVFDRTEPIRDDDIYGGYRVSFFARYGKINAPMSMDVSTGDIITPEPKLRTYKGFLDKDEQFELYSYSLETVLAEKVETILSRGINNTRPRDFYDVYILSQNEYDCDVFKEALKATSIHRNTYKDIRDYQKILDVILGDNAMNNRWVSYANKTHYASGITFFDTIDRVKEILD